MTGATGQPWADSQGLRYFLIGMGLIIVLGAIGVISQFPVSTSAGFFSLAMIIVGGIDLIAAGFAVANGESIEQSSQGPSVGLGLVTFGLALLAFPAVEALNLSIEWEDILTGMSGLGLLLIGLIHMVRPKLIANSSERTQSHNSQ